MPSLITTHGTSRYRADALNPEVLDSRLANVEALARWLDYAFTLPGGFQFGFAGIIGFIPGIGDVFDAILSLYIVGRAVQLGLPRVALARMLVNVGIEGLAGSVPFLGNFFDIAFKANRRNYELLRKHLVQPARSRKQDWVFLLLTLLVVLASLVLPVFGLIELARHL